MTRYAALTLGFALVAGASTARASTIIIDQPPDQRLIYYADTDYMFTAAAESFQLLAATTITDAQWWGGCFPSADPSVPSSAASGSASSSCPTSGNNFVITFYTDNVGPDSPVPGGSFLVGNANQTPTGTVAMPGKIVGGTVPPGSGNIAEYVYTAQFTLALSAGTYWFAVSNTVPGSNTWGWETSGGEGEHHQFVTAWGSQPDNLAFRLTAADNGAPTEVPEPATLSLLGFGLAAAALRRRRSR